MVNITTVTDAELDALLNDAAPLLLLLSNGDGLRGDFSTAFNKAAESHPDIRFARLNPDSSPQAKARFKLGSKPLLIGWLAGEEVLRRSRPWGVDVSGAVDLIRAAQQARTTEDAAPVVAADHGAAQPDAAPDSVQSQAAQVAKDKLLVDTTPVDVTDQTFQEEVVDHHLPVVIDYWAPWCAPCRMVAPILDKLAEEYAGKIRIAKVNVDENQGLAQHFQIMSIPTLMMIKDKHIVFSQPGALPEPAMRDLVEQLIALEIPEHDGHDHEHEHED